MGGKMKRTNLELSVGIFVFLGLICIGYLTIKLGKMELIGNNNYTLYARFQSISGLKPGAHIEIAGVNVGKVEKISLDQERQMAVVELKVQNDIEVFDDAIASVKTSGLIGDKYIMLSPGGSDEKLKPGDMIIETESAIDIESLISKYIFGDV